MWQQHETKIERIVREYTPDFVVGTSNLVDQFHSYKFLCQVLFARGKFVQKKDSEGNNKIFKSANPDFVLLNKKQLDSLNEAILTASKGKPYHDPIRRRAGWYIELFGDYWHSEELTGVPTQEHEKQVREAYESNGNHVLILWEHDILNHWNEKTKPMIDKFISDFAKEHEVDFNCRLSENKALSDLSLTCLNNPIEYRELSNEEKQIVVDDLVNCYKSIIPYDNFSEAREDLLKLEQRMKEGIKGSCSAGNQIINHFVKSRLSARVKGHRSLLELWQDENLMRKCIHWQFMNETGVHHSNRFLAAMTFKEGFRTISNLNQGVIVHRIKEYAIPGGIFFDPCAGWGGRLLAAHMLGMKYVAIDANRKLVEELKEMAKFIGSDAEIYWGNSADSRFVNSVLKNRTIDLAFTCPPYFDEEYYSDDKYQSILKYPEREVWEDKFLRRMINNVLGNLSIWGKFIMSVDEKVDLRRVPGIRVNIISSSMRKTEDDYFIIEQSNICTLAESSFVKCEICGGHFRALKTHLTRMHHVPADLYLEKYPGAKMVCEEEQQRIAKSNSEKYHGVKKKYIKRTAYLLPDGTYTGITHKYKKEWKTDTVNPAHIFDAEKVGYISQDNREFSEGTEGVDFVSCKICGERKGNLTQHLRKVHNISKEDYMKQYNAEIYSQKAKESQHLCALHKWQTQKSINTKK